MRFNGRLNEWNDDRGFGFAFVPGQAERVFVHVKAFEGHSRRPEAGDMLTFEKASGPKGLVAKRIRHATKTRPEDESERRAGKRAFVIDWAIAAILMPLQFMVVAQLPLPGWKWAALPGAMLVAFIAFNLDKGYALRGQRRTPESTLILLSVPGWVGALVAQQLFRHKSSKQTFYNAFRALGLIEIGVIGWQLWKGF